MGRLGLGSLAIFINGKVWLDTGLSPSQTCSPNMNLLASDRDLKERIRNWVLREVVMVRLTERAVPPTPPAYNQCFPIFQLKVNTAGRTLKQTLLNTEDGPLWRNPIS